MSPLPQKCITSGEADGQDRDEKHVLSCSWRCLETFHYRLLWCSWFSSQSSRSPESPVQRGAHPHGALQGSGCLKESEQMDRMILDAFLAISSSFFPQLYHSRPFPPPAAWKWPPVNLLYLIIQNQVMSQAMQVLRRCSLCWKLSLNISLLGRCWMFQVEMSHSPLKSFFCEVDVMLFDQLVCEKQHIGAIKLQQWHINGSCVFCRIPWPHAELPFVAMLCKSVGYSKLKNRTKIN